MLSQVLFPSVVVCNINQIRKSLFNELGFYENETLVSNVDEKMMLKTKSQINDLAFNTITSTLEDKTYTVYPRLFSFQVRIMYEDFIKGTKDNSENSTYTGFPTDKLVSISKFGDKTGSIKTLTRH